MPRKTRPHPPDQHKSAKAKLRQLNEAAFRGEFLAWCAKNNWPVPHFEYRHDPNRMWRFDVAWPEHKVALEIEGNVWHKSRHTTGKGFLQDCDKYNTATAKGWLVLRVARPPQAQNIQSVLYRNTLALWLDNLLPVMP